MKWCNSQIQLIFIFAPSPFLHTGEAWAVSAPLAVFHRSAMRSRWQRKRHWGGCEKKTQARLSHFDRSESITRVENNTYNFFSTSLLHLTLVPSLLSLSSSSLYICLSISLPLPLSLYRHVQGQASCCTGVPGLLRSAHPFLTRYGKRSTL